jgi:hypothetical protein
VRPSAIDLHIFSVLAVVFLYPSLWATPDLHTSWGRVSYAQVFLPNTQRLL